MSSPNTPLPHLRILIIGAGVSGLLNHIYLTANLPASIPYTIQILESYDHARRSASSLPSDDSPITSLTEDPTASPIGGGLGLGPNALRNIRRFDPILHAELVAAGYPMRRFEIRSSWGFRVGNLVAAEEREGGEGTVMMLRQVLWEVLKKRVPDAAFRWKDRVTQVRKLDTGEMQVVLENGTEEIADLVIGADGLKSAVRNYITGDGFQAKFEGLASVQGVISSSVLPPLPSDNLTPAPASAVVMNFGSEGFLAWAPVSHTPDPTNPSISNPDYAPPYGPKAMWISTFSVPPGTDPKALKASEVREQLIQRHGNWSSPVIRAIVNESPITGVWATYAVDKLPSLHRDAVVLTGDAAHALPPQGGQGVSQAVEDAIALTTLLGHHLGGISDIKKEGYAEAMSRALAAYTTLRKPRVDHMIDVSRGIGQAHRKKSLLMEWAMYALMAVTTRLGVGPMAHTRETFAYDIEVEVGKLVEPENAPVSFFED